MSDDKDDGVTMEKLEELIKEFQRANGNKNYTQKDIIKSIFTAINRLDSKIDTQMTDMRKYWQDRHDKMGTLLDNHIVHIQKSESILAQRVSKQEATLSTLKYILGAILISIVGLIIQSFIV